MIGRDIPEVEAREHTVKSETPSLQLSNLSVKSKDPFGTSLKNIELAVRPGEIVGVAGVSGNGQQELSRLISGEDTSPSLSADSITMFGTAPNTAPLRDVNWDSRSYPKKDLDAARFRQCHYQKMPC